MQFLSVALLCSVVLCVLAEDCPSDRCPPDETCCPTPTPGYYGCCRMPNATCCSDGKRCCPHGMECGIDQCTVRQPARSPSTLEKRQLITEPILEEDFTDSVTTESYAARLNMCNRRSYCPNTYACCIEPSGGYNCCPPNSTCCANSGHCCPYGTLCDLDLGTCRPGTPFGKRQGLIENYDMNEANINRCDKQFHCPDEYSCCMRKNGEYGCCPYQNAVCCGDHLHCCQQGERCLGANMCIREDMVFMPSNMERAVPFLTEEGDLHV